MICAGTIKKRSARSHRSGAREVEVDLPGGPQREIDSGHEKRR